MTGTDIVHIPYKGGAPAIADLIAGHVQLMFESTNSIAPHVKAGRVRALAVTGERRASALAEVPTLIEAGVPGYEVNAWSGIITTAGVPRPVLDRLNAARPRSSPRSSGATRPSGPRSCAAPARRSTEEVLMKRSALLALALPSSLVLAQTPTRVRGTITSLDGAALTIDGKQQVRLGEKTEIVFTQPIALSEIKPGDFLGVTSQRRAAATTRP